METDDESIVRPGGETMNGNFGMQFDAGAPSELAGAKMIGLLKDNQRDPGVLVTKRIKPDCPLLVRSTCGDREVAVVVRKRAAELFCLRSRRTI